MPVYSRQHCRYGEMLFYSNDDTIGRSLKLYGEWSEPETFVFQQILRPGDWVIEAGANIGTHTVMMSAAVGDTGRIHAFEPQRHAYQLLCANLALNDCINVHAHHAAVGQTDGTVEFPSVDPRQSVNFGAVSLLIEHPHTDHETVPMQRLDALQLPRLDLLKADVEGFEAQVLQGAQHTIAKHRPLLHLEYMNPYSGNTGGPLFDFLAPLDYRLWFYITPLFNPHNRRQESENVFPGLWSFDLIAIPREKGAMQGLVEMHSATDLRACTDIHAWRQVRFERHGS